LLAAAAVVMEQEALAEALAVAALAAF